MNLYFRPLSLSSYTAIFIVFTLGLFSILGWITVGQLQTARDDIQEVQQTAAQTELQDAIQHVQHLVTSRTKLLANWDELYQQLNNSTYFAYWREHRLMNSGLLSFKALAIQVYDAQGKALMWSPDSDSPESVTSIDHAPYVVRHQEKIHLHVVSPVLGGADGDTLQGYVGVSADFRELLISLYRFRFLDEQGLRFTLLVGDRIALSQVQQFGEYSLRKNPEVRTAQEVMETAVLRLAATIGVLAVIFYVMLASLFGLPLRRLLLDLEKMKLSPESINGGESVKPLPVVELEKVRQSLAEYQLQLLEVHSNLDEKNKALWDMAHLDPLTGAFNRRAFDVDWQALRTVLQGKALNIAFILFDCNHFKAINDTYGHQVGDQVIEALAQCIRSGLRNDDRLYRLGGDEFATILKNCSAQRARDVAQRCVNVVEDKDFSVYGIREPVRVSVGVALAEGDDVDALNSLQWRADIAMYRAKRPESAHIEFYSDGVDDGADTLVSSQVSNAVYDVIRDGAGIVIYYQPIVDLSTQRVAYYEALARIKYEGVLLMPSQFLPVVETRRLYTEFDIAVQGAILRDLERGLIPVGTGVSINLSGYSLIHDKMTKALLKFKRFSEEYKLVLEVTETALIRQLEIATLNLSEVRQAGFTVALDDFGSGYSSLRYLADMPVDIVKFDITMVRQLTASGQSKYMIEQLASLISKAGYKLVAEGIETFEHQSTATDAKFDFGQGYRFGRPVPITELVHPKNLAIEVE